MPPTNVPLTLIVATTPSLGIGLKGSLPWPPLKSDLAFFARVTKRVPAAITSTSSTLAHDGTNNSSNNTKNAVIMGRKTWESIPSKFRPLKGRINVIITRSPEGLKSTLEAHNGEVFAASSIEEALKELKSRFPPSILGTHDSGKATDQFSFNPSAFTLGRSFIIGGADIYKLALKTVTCERILWTRLESDFECDTFFPPGALSTPGKSPQSPPQQHDGTWTARSNEELQAWTGEKDAGLPVVDGDVHYRVVMLEKNAAVGQD